jgi:hypothetical protein
MVERTTGVVSIANRLYAELAGSNYTSSHNSSQKLHKTTGTFHNDGQIDHRRRPTKHKMHHYLSALPSELRI